MTDVATAVVTSDILNLVDTGSRRIGKRCVFVTIVEDQIALFHQTTNGIRIAGVKKLMWFIHFKVVVLDINERTSGEGSFNNYT